MSVYGPACYPVVVVARKTKNFVFTFIRFYNMLRYVCLVVPLEDRICHNFSKVWNEDALSSIFLFAKNFSGSKFAGPPFTIVLRRFNRIYNRALIELSQLKPSLFR